MSETTAVRTVSGRQVPATGKWQVDTRHSVVEFVARHLMVTKVRGHFDDYNVDLIIAEDPTQSQLDVTIKTDSIVTPDPDRDTHLKGADFLNVEKYPEITFRSTSIKPDGDDWAVTGDLTVMGVTRPVTLDVEFGGVQVDPWGNSKALFSAKTEFDRDDFGLSWNQPLAGGGFLIGKRVTVEIEVQASPAA